MWWTELLYMEAKNAASLDMGVDSQSSNQKSSHEGVPRTKKEGRNITFYNPPYNQMLNKYMP